MFNIQKSKINRIIIHRVEARVDDQPVEVECSDSLYAFGVYELSTLKERVHKAFDRDRKAFKLKIALSGSDTFFSHSTICKGKSDDVFIENTKKIAELLAKSHKKRTIPPGLLVAFDGQEELGRYFFGVIKAEIHDALAITPDETTKEKMVKYLKEIFLSPGKDFYKIGIIVEEPKPDGEFPNNGYAAYMYDDQFTRNRRDLTEYFYDEFMGLTTSENDKILSKRFYDDMEDLIRESKLSFDDKRGQKLILKGIFREGNNGVIDPKAYGEQFVHPDLLEIYKIRILNEYPHPFVKEDGLIDRTLLRDHIQLVNNLKIEGPTDSVGAVQVFNNPQESFDKIKMQVDDGKIEQVITISTVKY
jgi:hypothetical protein